MQHYLFTARRIVAGGLTTMLGIVMAIIFGMILFIPACIVAVIARMNGDYKRIFGVTK